MVFPHLPDNSILRVAVLEDIDAMHQVRMAVKENVLNNPSLVTYEDYVKYISPPNKGWICSIDNQLIGFAIVNLEENNIWALFVDPVYEKRGIGRLLHEEMIAWYFRQTDKPLWLSTEPGTRAASFYKKAGWIHSGAYGSKEIKFIFNSPANIAR